MITKMEQKEYTRIIVELSQKRCYDNEDWSKAKQAYDNMMLRLNELAHIAKTKLVWREEDKPVFRTDFKEHKRLYNLFKSSDIGYVVIRGY